MTYDALLAQFKSAFQTEDALLPILENELMTYTAVWHRVHVDRLPVEPIDETWQALWQCVKVDVQSLALLLDVPDNKAARVLARLQALRVIYPDGSTPELIKKLINKRVAEAINKR